MGFAPCPYALHPIHRQSSPQPSFVFAHDSQDLVLLPVRHCPVARGPGGGAFLWSVGIPYTGVEEGLGPSNLCGLDDGLPTRRVLFTGLQQIHFARALFIASASVLRLTALEVGSEPRLDLLPLHAAVQAASGVPLLTTPARDAQTCARELVGPVCSSRRNRSSGGAALSGVRATFIACTLSALAMSPDRRCIPLTR